MRHYGPLSWIVANPVLQATAAEPNHRYGILET
ncbi:MAG: hypothetical protein KatS3mg040_0815 [Candidatus Kapaibacterium sp.]|nr:MAG: hypothetical protein KatS3mg040_0815 [Candidatus Kapabacteria bacterium]